MTLVEASDRSHTVSFEIDKGIEQGDKNCLVLATFD